MPDSSSMSGSASVDGFGVALSQAALRRSTSLVGAQPPASNESRSDPETAWHIIGVCPPRTESVLSAIHPSTATVYTPVVSCSAVPEGDAARCLGVYGRETSHRPPPLLSLGTGSGLCLPAVTAGSNSSSSSPEMWPGSSMRASRRAAHAFVALSMPRVVDALSAKSGDRVFTAKELAVVGSFLSLVFLFLYKVRVGSELA